ncbi:ABC transporter permease [candidate division KSB1 bacterium]
MNETPDISAYSMILLFLLLIIPVVMGRILRLSITKTLLSAVIRMTVQLFLVGIYLTYLFRINQPVITLIWLFVMITFASFSVIRNSNLGWRHFYLPVTAALVITNVTVLFYFNAFIIRLTDLFEAKFVIAIGGMLLGNAMRGTIIGVNNFYRDVRRNENRFLFNLSKGATCFEAGSVHLRRSLIDAIKPSLASMATMGVVFLPGMMTGQIIGGSSPLVAIEYQIAIMIIIFVSTMLTIGLTVLFTMKQSFDGYGLLKREIFQ